MGYFPTRFLPGTKNFVETVMFHPCADPMPLLVQTFFPAALKMAFTLYTFDLFDIAQNRLRDYPRLRMPRTPSRAGSHLAKKKEPKRAFSRRLIDAHKGVYHPYAKTLTSFLFYLTWPLERLGLAILLYNAVDDFFYDWQYLLIEAGYCTFPANTGPLVRYTTEGSQIFPIGDAPVSCVTLEQNRASWPSTATAVTVPTGTFTVIFSMDVKSVGAYLGGIYLQVGISLGGVTPFYEQSAPAFVNNETWTPIFVTATFTNNLFAFAQIEWKAGSFAAPVGLCEFKNARVTVTRQVLA